MFDTTQALPFGPPTRPSNPNPNPNCVFSHTCGRPPVAMFDTTQAASFRTSHSAVAICVITIETKPLVMARACTC